MMTKRAIAPEYKIKGTIFLDEITFRVLVMSSFQWKVQKANEIRASTDIKVP